MQNSRSKELGYLFVIGGPGGCGSSTISKMLARKFGLTVVSAGKIFRSVVRDCGYSHLENIYKELPIEDIYEFDRVTDEKMIAISNTPNILIESKGFAGVATNKNIPCTVKIWLNCSDDVRTRRHLQRDGYTTFPHKIVKYFKQKKFLQERLDSDRRRYKVLYDMDYDKPELYNDIVINNTSQSVSETYNLILKKNKGWRIH